MTREEKAAEMFAIPSRKRNIRPTPRPKGKPQTFPCIYRDDDGPKLADATCAEGCRKGIRFPVRACSKFGSCVVAKTTVEGYRCCRDCKERVAVAPKEIEQSSSNTADSGCRRVAVSLPEGHFNGSIIEWRGRRLIASRLHSRIHLSELDGENNLLWTRQLILVRFPHRQLRRERALVSGACFGAGDVSGEIWKFVDKP